MKTLLRCVLALAAFAMVSGCATAIPKEVSVPVALKCDAIVPSEPVWATKSLPTDAQIFEQVKAILAERQQAAGYQDELKSALVECAGGDDLDLDLSDLSFDDDLGE